MDAKFLYCVFEEAEKNNFPDLYLGLAAAQVNHPISHEEDKEIREFIGRHYDALVNAYATHHLDEFEDTVAKCVAADAANEQ